MKFCFVVLHYLEGAIEDTFECVNSILNNIEHEDYTITLVDNGSNDSSKILLEEKYRDNNVIDIISINSNVGFAKGNNYGARHAIDKYDPDFLVVINNDTMITQSEFLDLIEVEYFEKPFGVLGPYIYDRNSKPQNPMQIEPIKSISDIEVKITNIKELRFKTEQIGKLSRIKNQMKKVLKKNNYVRMLINEINKRRFTPNYIYNPTEEIENVPLHGSALIFSKDFFRYKDYIFYPETFLYVEEEILFYICNRDKHTMRYQPKLKIHHKEDSSSNALFHNEYDKRIFVYEQHINSYRVFRDLLINEKGWDE